MRGAKLEQQWSAPSGGSSPPGFVGWRRRLLSIGLRRVATMVRGDRTVAWGAAGSAPSGDSSPPGGDGRWRLLSIGLRQAATVVRGDRETTWGAAGVGAERRLLSTRLRRAVATPLHRAASGAGRGEGRSGGSVGAAEQRRERFPATGERADLRRGGERVRDEEGKGNVEREEKEEESEWERPAAARFAIAGDETTCRVGLSSFSCLCFVFPAKIY